MLTLCTPGSALSPTLGNEYARTLLVYIVQVEDHVGLHSVGTAAIVVQVTGTNWPKPAYTLLATGLCRFKVDNLLQETPYLVAKVTQLDKLSREDVGENRI